MVRAGRKLHVCEVARKVEPRLCGALADTIEVFVDGMALKGREREARVWDTEPWVRSSRASPGAPVRYARMALRRRERDIVKIWACKRRDKSCTPSSFLLTAMPRVGNCRYIIGYEGAP